MITGGAGFGGSSLALKLKELGHDIVLNDIIAPNSLPVKLQSFAYLWKAVHDLNEANIAEIDTIFHFAAQADVPLAISSPRYTFMQNVSGMLNVLEVTKHLDLDKIILSSSGNVFGRATSLPIKEDSLPVAHNIYSASKASCESLCSAYYHSYNSPTIITRSGIAYGRGMRKNVFLYIWFKKLLQGEAILVEGGAQTRDLTHINDLVEAWVKLLNIEPRFVVGSKFHFASGVDTTVYELANLCCEVAGRAPSKYINIIEYRPGEEGMVEHFDVSKAERELEWKATTDLKDGLKDLYEWIKYEEGR
jgi:UDP-glucose 4-epimerase